MKTNYIEKLMADASNAQNILGSYNQEKIDTIVDSI